MQHHPTLMEIVRRDPRYAYEAYVFVFEALAHTQKLLGRGVAEGKEEAGKVERHVSGAELVEGARDLALRQFGRMARVVFRLWGINRTDDFGEIVFNLIDAKMLSKTDADSRDDFRDLFDLDKALVEEFAINPGEVPWLKRGGR
ncbi:MAG TPA: Minf_1886 family protein [Gemmataceae bacterium]